MLLTYHGSSKWAALHPSPPAAFVASACVTHSCCVSIDIAARRLIILDNRNTPCVRQAARRRGRYVEEEGKEEDEDGEYGYNAEIAMLEAYSRSAREEALLVNAVLDDREEQVLIFKGFSSSLSYRTVADPSKSVVPSRAVIKSIDRVKGPFNPSNIQYIEEGLTMEAFRARLQPN
ncbi:hypothetical protein Nepgr_022185 [Nepenthes gracilis]|uniref:DUF7734 domain-containing protein n=1 Tax=Nepenthes gracilis TaxID=150966 RepID=A0AAD3T0E2_NEPGR|nr:hypothetical protein Nepgr_022185 [Nepenthes gracilis]